MPGRYYDRSRAIDKAVTQVEAILVNVLLDAFRHLWAALFPKIRDGRLDEIDQMLNEWEQRLDEDYDDALAVGGGVIAKAEADWWAANGVDIDLSGDDVARQFIADTTTMSGHPPAIMIAENIRDGIHSEIAKANADPTMTPDKLNARLRRWMDEARARGNASTDTTSLLSVVTKIGMGKAGAGFWVWQATEIAPGVLDDKVCDDCASRHGRTYSINDKMPPIHKHDRCTPVPLKQWLRTHDQPYYSIAEGLVQR